MKKNPLLLLIPAVIIVAGIAIYLNTPTPANAPVSPQTNVPAIPSAPQTSRELVQSCTTDMATQFHIHQHLNIIIEGQPVIIPANIGIDLQKGCMSPIHTHDESGIIHVESPVQIDFKLSDFFYNWKINFDKTQINDYKVDKDHGLKFYVNGQESTDFENLVLKDHEEITIIYYKLTDGPGALPAPYNWDQQ